MHCRKDAQLCDVREMQIQAAVRTLHAFADEIFNSCKFWKTFRKTGSSDYWDYKIYGYFEKMLVTKLSYKEKIEVQGQEK